MIEIKEAKDLNKILARLDKAYRIEAFIQYAHFKLNEFYVNRFADEQSFQKAHYRAITRSMANALAVQIEQIVHEVNAELEGICSSEEIAGISAFLKFNTINTHQEAFWTMTRNFNFKRLDMICVDRWLDAVRDFNASFCDNYESYLLETAKDFKKLLALFALKPDEKHLEIMESAIRSDVEQYNAKNWDKRIQSFNLLFRAPNYLSNDYTSDVIDHMVANLITYPTITSPDGQPPRMTSFFNGQVQNMMINKTFPYVEFDEWLAANKGDMFMKTLNWLHKHNGVGGFDSELFNDTRTPYGQSHLICTLSTLASMYVALDNTASEQTEIVVVCSYSSPYRHQDAWELIAQKSLSFTNIAHEDIIQNSASQLKHPESFINQAKTMLVTNQLETLADCCGIPLEKSAEEYVLQALKNEEVNHQPKVTRAFIDSVAVDSLVYIPEKIDVQSGFFDATSTIGSYS